MFFPSKTLEAGVGTPTILATVGSMSAMCVGSSTSEPGSNTPGKRSIVGRRIPPSYVLVLPPKYEKKKSEEYCLNIILNTYA